MKAVHYFKTSEHLTTKQCKKPEDNHIILYFSLQVIVTHGQRETQIAIVCVTDIAADKTDCTHHLMQCILNPICHGLAIICSLTIAVVYFVMPQLRDLVGNILTSISLCLITSQAADLVRIFTEFTSHVSFLVAGAFFKPAAVLNVLMLQLRVFYITWYSSLLYLSISLFAINNKFGIQSFFMLTCFITILFMFSLVM